MIERLAGLFATDLFMPHGHCYLWRPGVLWLHVVTDTLIWLAYIAIAVTLAYLSARVGDLPFRWVYFAFGAFIVSCGFTHFFEVWTVWKPIYWFSGGVKAVTAVVSVATAALLPPLVPKAVALARGSRVAREKGIQLETAYHDLGTMYEKARELEQLKTQFFANVSHELRTPLALILGPTEKLLAEALPESQRRDLEVVARNARTLLKHVNDLLDVSKLEAGKMEVDYTRTDLGALVRLVAAHFDALAEERRIELCVEAPEELSGELDIEKIQRVVLNLISNAFKFTPAGGRVRCQVSRVEPGRARIEIADSGPGIAPQMREAVFERFRQADGSATRRFGGTGLGLAIAKDFVDLHGGSIGAADAPEGGVLFFIELPLAAPAGAAVREAPAADARLSEAMTRQSLVELQTRLEAAAGPSAPGRPLVLVVEDNPEMNRFLRETLSAEYRTAGALDGREGLEKAQELSPDLVLTDVMMPALSGDALVAELRSRREFDGTPIVLLTAKADDELRVRLLKGGAQDYLMKPFSAEELKARVGNLVTIKRAREVLQRELESQAGDLEELAGEAASRKRELQTALDAMRVAREQAERASRVKTDFLGLVSHELRTPLTTIQLQLERLRRDRQATLSPRQREIVDRVATSSVRLIDLIESLLEYTRLESGRLSLQLARFDPAGIVSEVVEDLSPQAEKKGLALRVSAPAGRPLESDPRLLRLILLNLLGNAIKYTAEGYVELTMERRDRESRFTIRDSGPGIPAAERARVFEPFTQLEPIGHKHTPGVGLGLALVRQMAEALGGRIQLESREGEGSVFTLVIPSKEA